MQSLQKKDRIEKRDERKRNFYSEEKSEKESDFDNHQFSFVFFLSSTFCSTTKFRTREHSRDMESTLLQKFERELVPLLFESFSAHLQLVDL